MSAEPVLICPAERQSCPTFAFVWENGMRERNRRCRYRIILLFHLRADLKRRQLKQTSIAAFTGKSSSWVGEVLRGNYPYYQSGVLTRDIYRYLLSRNIAVPPELVPPGL